MKALFFLLVAVGVLALAATVTLGALGIWNGDARWGETAVLSGFLTFAFGLAGGLVGSSAFEGKR